MSAWGASVPRGGGLLLPGGQQFEAFLDRPDPLDARQSAVEPACAQQLAARTLTKLYNARPAWLAACHAKLDAAVAAAYGWPADLTDEAILERLLALNQAASG